MSKICPNCGRSVEENYKFCPSCGSKIENDNDVILCSNCGTENSHSETFCTKCGVKLNSNDNVQKAKPSNSSRQLVSETKSDGTESTDEPHEHKNQNNDEKKTVEKTLSKGKLSAIFVGVLGLILILLIVKGVFNQTVTPTNNTPPSSNPQVNPADLQKINELAAQVKANPNNLELLLELAHLRNDSGFFQQAINDYQTYLEKRPNDVDARIDVGVCYYNLNNFAKAVEEMEKAIKIKPDHQKGLLNLGVVNLIAGNFEKSNKWLKKAIKVDSNSQFGKMAQELLKAHKNN